MVLMLNIIIKYQNSVKETNLVPTHMVNILFDDNILTFSAQYGLILLRPPRLSEDRLLHSWKTNGCVR